jgi:hypothetical protein
VPLPSRVVDCTDPLKPKLIITNGREGRYFALSYVWGEPQEHTTTSRNVEEYQRGIDISIMPQTIKDAVRLTHSLKCQFLWIDTLCILQDSRKDKAQEIAKMRRIYHDAYLVIVAASATKVSDGFLQPRSGAPASPQTGDVPLAFELPGGRGVGSFYFSLTWKNGPGPGVTGEEYDPSVEPVNTRGWCYQEYMLSSRALLFTSHTLQYHCQTTVADVGRSCNDLGVTELRLPDVVLGRSPPTTGATSPLPRSPLSAEEWEASREGWFSARGNYTRRSLTSPEDKLVAFAGIAELFHNAWDQTPYLAGLWEDTLLEDLLWHRQPGADRVLLPRPARYRAPSWSWASVDGYIEGGVKRWVEPAGGRGERSGRCEILRCSVELADPALPFGEVVGGTLVLRAALVKASWTPHAKTNYVFALPPGREPDEDESSTDDESGADCPPDCIGTAWMDSSDDAQLETVWAVPLTWEKPIMVYGLLLALMNPGEGDERRRRYRRVGLLRTHANADDIDWIGWCDAVEIVIE